MEQITKCKVTKNKTTPRYSTLNKNGMELGKQLIFAVGIY